MIRPPIPTGRMKSGLSKPRCSEHFPDIELTSSMKQFTEHNDIEDACRTVAEHYYGPTLPGRTALSSGSTRNYSSESCRFP
jgi:hypothetical protein